MEHLARVQFPSAAPMKRKLSNVTLFGLDCVNIERLILAANICEKDFEFGEIKLLSSLPSTDPRVVSIAPIISKEEYSYFVVKHLNDYIDTDFVLVIQHDGFILNPDAWTDEFLNYDYIGAPWWEEGKFIVGNGGFSLRSKKLHELLQKDVLIQMQPGDPEDWFISVIKREYLESKGVRFAPIELAKQFSLESNEVLGVEWTNQFGFHGLTWTDISKWLKDHPEYSIQNELDSWALGVKSKLASK